MSSCVFDSSFYAFDLRLNLEGEIITLRCFPVLVADFRELEEAYFDLCVICKGEKVIIYMFSDPYDPSWVMSCGIFSFIYNAN